MAESLVSVIIVNYNGKKFLGDCISSVKQNARYSHEIIVVDNASTDGSAEYVENNFPGVSIVRAKKNLGFTAGNNLGAKSAKGKYLLLLNNDTRLITSLTPALREFDNDKKLGALGCRMYFDGGGFQASFGYEHTPLRIILTWTGLYRFTGSTLVREIDENESSYAKPRDVDWVTGAFLMTPKSLWDNLGGLDENYFMYVEDGDYCKRARQAGFRVAYTPNVEIIHYRGGGRPWGGERALFNQMDSYVTYTRKFHNGFVLFFFRTALGTIMSCRALAYFLLGLFNNKAGLSEKQRAFFGAALRLLKIR
ncbi:glycosyltransferase family 2 protein [bacterium]|nr:MAG: glycosyltransferase family 2 protein [bacterium]